MNNEDEEESPKQAAKRMKIQKDKGKSKLKEPQPGTSSEPHIPPESISDDEYFIPELESDLLTTEIESTDEFIEYKSHLKRKEILYRSVVATHSERNFKLINDSMKSTDNNNEDSPNDLNSSSKENDSLDYLEHVSISSNASSVEFVSIEKIPIDEDVSDQDKNSLDITASIESLANNHTELIIKKRANQDGENAKFLKVIENESEYIIKFCTKNEEIKCPLSISVEENNGELDDNKDETTETPSTSSTDPFLNLTEEQKTRIKNNKHNALNILHRKKVLRRKQKKACAKKFTTKTKKKKTKLNVASLVSKPKEDSIPSLTSHVNNMSNPLRKFAEVLNQKFQTILINDFLAAKRKFEIPILYEHKHIEFKYVNIVGTIVGVYTNITEKIQLIIEDTTGRVTCVIEPKKNGRRITINKRLEKWEEKIKEPRYVLGIKKPELLSIMEETDNEFGKKLAAKKQLGADLLHTVGYIALRKAKPYLVDEYPSKSNLLLSENSIGRHVSVTGKAYDWSDERIVYVWDIKFITMDEFFIMINNLFKENIYV